MKEEKENLRKSIDFFKKVEEEIKEKEQKLAENIKHAEEEATHSKRRAEKYYLIYLDKLKRARLMPSLKSPKSCLRWLIALQTAKSTLSSMKIKINTLSRSSRANKLSRIS